MNEKPDNPAPKPAKPRIERTPDEQAAIDKFHAQIGQALVNNLNRNVLRQAQEDEAARKGDKPVGR